ncbi:Adducin [Operophtera brumata]|uniref:Adducin n=1 Tax=Operophtera brumata TaxID=104452 RepID=A0A0L7LF66_OPEBR|nr:Adducin [Operophtera brumata]
MLIHVVSARLHAPLLTGTKEATADALTSSKRSLHDYTRNTNFDNIVKIYDSPDKANAKTHPKCKLSLSHRLGNGDHASSSSLSSIPSIEWDGRCKTDYNSRTRSLTRQRVSSLNKLYRTRSHSGFVNSYLKDPEPLHYHLPRCRSCGAVNSTYSLKEDLMLYTNKNKMPTSVFLSVDNIHQKCNEETEKVKVKETVLPVFKVPKVPEFVESQEFNEDNYLGDLNSFSSNNQTVIEKTDVIVTQHIVSDKEMKEDENSETYRAEYAQIENDENDNTLETNEGEYLSFTDDFEEAYESPVKDLVEKDIRDYSVPIDFYCDDYNKKNDSPQKSPFKSREGPLNVLEPILEESKSSYGDDSGILSQEKRDSVQLTTEKTLDDVLGAGVIAVQSSEDCEEVKVQEVNPIKQNEEMSNVIAQLNEENTCEIVNMHEVNTEQETNVMVPLVEGNSEMVLEALPENETAENHKIKCDKSEVDIANRDVKLLDNDSKCVQSKVERKSSIEYSVTSSTIETVSFNSTVEFEKYEVIVDLLTNLLNKIDYEDTGRGFFSLVENKHNTNNLLEDKIEAEIDEFENKDEPNDVKKGENAANILESDEHFSITKMIEEFEEQTVNLNETILTENSESGITESFKVAESLLYYIFDTVFVVENDMNKKRTNKTVVTVVDAEDIIYTSVSLWPESDENENFEMGINFEGEQTNFEDIQNYIALVEQPHSNDMYNDELEEEANPNDEAEFYLPDFNKKDYSTTNFVDKQTNETFEYFNEQIDDELLRHIEEDKTLNEDESKASSDNYKEIADVGFKEINYHCDDKLKRVKYEEETMLELGLEVTQNVVNVSADGDHPITENFVESELEMVLNNPVGSLDHHNSEYNKDDYSTTDDEECKELSQNSIEVADDIVYEIFNNVSQAVNVSMIYEETNTKMHVYDEKYGKETVVKKADFNEYFVETDDVNSTFIERDDKMNTAFVHDEYHNHASSPRKYSKVFDACDESPIRNPNTSFVGQDLSILYDKEETILGSPFIKQAAVISMSLTENTAGIKYWLSFDECVTENNDVTYRRSLKNTDDTIPSFYGVNFGNDEANDGKRHFNRKRSILINEIDNQKDTPGEGSNDENDTKNLTEMPKLTSPGSSYFYDTCESTLLDDSPQRKYEFDAQQRLYDFDCPQKKLLYEVQRKQDRLYMTWPPFEDTLFYRIISNFRLSESFDASELDRARIDSI